MRRDPLQKQGPRHEGDVVAAGRVLPRAQILLALDQGILDQQIAGIVQVERTRI